MNYRLLYSKKMDGLTWNKEKYEIHHIDLNHNNDDFENLVLIPTKLHNFFHTYFSEVQRLVELSKIDLLSPELEYHGFISMVIKSCNEFLKAKADMCYFWTLKQSIFDGKMPVGLEKDDEYWEKIIKITSPSIYEKYCI